MHVWRSTAWTLRSFSAHFLGGVGGLCNTFPSPPSNGVPTIRKSKTNVSCYRFVTWQHLFKNAICLDLLLCNFSIFYLCLFFLLRFVCMYGYASFPLWSTLWRLCSRKVLYTYSLFKKAFSLSSGLESPGPSHPSWTMDMQNMYPSAMWITWQEPSQTNLDMLTRQWKASPSCWLTVVGCCSFWRTKFTPRSCLLEGLFQAIFMLVFVVQCCRRLPFVSPKMIVSLCKLWLISYEEISLQLTISG